MNEIWYKPKHHCYIDNISEIIREQYLPILGMLYFNLSEHKNIHC